LIDSDPAIEAQARFLGEFELRSNPTANNDKVGLKGNAAL
jgi:hypothetical protein